MEGNRNQLSLLKNTINKEVNAWFNSGLIIQINIQNHITKYY